jgi:hypothetical protein
MGMKWIREYYKVPARRGVQVRYRGWAGVITGATGQYLRIRLNGDKRSDVYHPTWSLEYLDDETGQPVNDAA